MSKQITLTLTEDEAHAVGFALMRAKRQMKEAADKHADDAHANELYRTLDRCVGLLDTAPETEVGA